MDQHQQQQQQQQHHQQQQQPKGPCWLNPTIQSKIAWRDDDVVISVPPKSGKVSRLLCTIHYIE